VRTPDDAASHHNLPDSIHFEKCKNFVADSAVDSNIELVFVPPLKGFDRSARRRRYANRHF
jgi:hypothetical protein